MAKERRPSHDLPQQQELSPEQREHVKENRSREDDVIDHRQTDGPNTPST